MSTISTTGAPGTPGTTGAGPRPGAAAPSARRHPGRLRRAHRHNLPLHYAVSIGAALFILVPLLFMFAGSVKPNADVLADGGSWRALLPTSVSADNFVSAWERSRFGQLLLNSLVICGLTVLGGAVVNSMFGYALARLRWVGRNAVLAVVIALIIIPFEALAIPLLLMVTEMGWLDTYQAQIVPFIAQPFFIYLFYSFFLGLPRELEEAAQVDGAGPWRTFRTIIVPLSRPVFASVAILSFLISWGQFLWPVMVTRSEAVRPLPVGMAVFQTLPPLQWGDIMAFATMMTVPVLIVFVIFQRAFVQGVAAQSVKE
ncbi:carbohydrate ABC transporter permease [Allostreptomyces psammosilenae]|uniref:Multiple sugar transport system permease protein n=1 Tax=Allostreptomyces psammosilenae TaxID=1892865 RepID=A0A852ZRV0_9ACTN|nr:carbohydrate ABC transporter permease [Allostreptomyces psammosilenae]NYI05166.1 multiple sugar transport system permease protein [Allostreptomyces psammosilenae]